MHTFLSHIPPFPTENSKCIIMLHGVWSNESDLFWLADYFSQSDYIFSLRGPFELGNNRAAWYPVDFSSGSPRYRSEDVEKGYEYIIGFIQQIQDEYRIPAERIFLMGFSQGAILSYYTLAKSPELLAGIIALSGRILPEISMSFEKERFSGKKIFIGHGSLDKVISVDASNGAIWFSEILGILPEVHIYSIGHSIAREEMNDIIAWLSRP